MAQKSNKSVLKLDWATYEAAKYACENWHYSGCLPTGKLVKIGVWEDKKFIGVVLFGRGASHNLGKKYNLKKTEVCELVRIALTKHKNPVSKILSIALKFFKKFNPKLKLIISFADPAQNHYGGIYQATNWLYDGFSDFGGALEYYYKGKWRHSRSMSSKFGPIGKDFAERNNIPFRKPTRKHRYFYPFDKEIRQNLLKLQKPYPKSVSSADSGTSGNHPEGGGASPTDTLQSYADRKEVV